MVAALCTVGLTACTEEPRSVATRTYDGVPDTYAGTTKDLIGEQYHAEWADEGNTLVVSAVYSSSCIAVPTELRADTRGTITLTFTPHQAEYPCVQGNHTVTFEFTKPPKVNPSRAVLIRIDGSPYLIAPLP